MCGICGFVYPDPESSVDPAALQSMSDAIRHRGPDASGVFFQPGLGLGHRRLSIIDLAGAVQPWSDANQQVTVVFNGEIYNFQELRTELIRLGHVFRTQGDTEVLVEGYLQWGTGLWERLVGMFAFAIWDARSRELLLVRDRLGVKPLYWWQGPNGELAFSSELTSLLAHPQIPRRINHEQVMRFLATTYVPGAPSIIEGIQRLSPGSCLRWNRNGASLQRWWKIEEIWRQQTPSKRSASELTTLFLDELRRAVRCRLISDVPVGVLLSGGLDSSIINALTAEVNPGLPSFSIGFEEASFDESPWARQVAQKLGSRHVVKMLGDVDTETVARILNGLDEPFADTSIVPTFLLCELARKDVTVAYSGDGGDELLAGYITHQATGWHRAAQRIPGTIRRWISAASGLIPDSRRKVNTLFKLKQFLKGLPLASDEVHGSWRILARGSELGRMFANGLVLNPDSVLDSFRNCWRQASPLSDLDRALCTDYRTWLVDDILVKADRASMLNSLEVRSPFLDHRLVEFCMQLPAELKRVGSDGKRLLKRVASQFLPWEVIHRKKAGFNAPVSHWLAGPLRELSDDHFQSPPGILHPPQIRRLWDEHRSGRRDHGMLLFNVLVLGMWLRRLKLDS